MVSSSLHLTRTFLPSLSLQMTSIITPLILRRHGTRFAFELIYETGCSAANREMASTSAPKRHGHSHRRASCIGENIDDEDDGAIDAMVNANDCSKVERAPSTSVIRYHTTPVILHVLPSLSTHTKLRPILGPTLGPSSTAPPPRPLRPASLKALAEP